MSNSKLLTTANNDFTVSLYQALYPSVSSENLIFSPFSLHAVLGMVAQGARGETRTEMREGLKFDEKNSDLVIARRYNTVITGLQEKGSPETFTVLTANRLYTRIGFDLNPTYVETLKTHFKADFEKLDFSSPSKRKAAAVKINKWVKAKTNNKIKNLVSPDSFGPTTSLLLVNGIYFKGFWEYSFDPINTSKQPFHVTRTKKVNVDMMCEKKRFAYGKLENLNAEAVALPYKGGRLSMVVILPKRVNGLATIQKNVGSILNGEGKSLVSGNLRKTLEVVLRLPKFKVETTLGDLQSVLEHLGMKSMFSPEEADFSGISGGGRGENSDFFVSGVIQKAFIQVDELGSEAAAFTGGYLRRSGGFPQPTIPFVVDRPFYYQIVDHANGDLVLFAGHVNDPTVV